MSNRLLVAFSGHIGSGKDEACKHLVKNFNFYHTKFAYPIQDMCAIIGGFYQPDKSHRLKFDNREWKENTILLFDNENKPVTIRQALKLIGTDLFRNQLAQNIWTNTLYNSLPSITEHPFACISDLRFPNELGFVRDLDSTYEHIGFLIYIDNPVAEDKALDVLNNNNHASEQHHDLLKSQADYIIYNNPLVNGIDKLKSDLNDIMSDILSIYTREVYLDSLKM